MLLPHTGHPCIACCLYEERSRRMLCHCVPVGGRSRLPSVVGVGHGTPLGNDDVLELVMQKQKRKER